MFRVIIAGGRDFDDYSILRSFMDKVLINTHGPIQVVCGNARGADTLGAWYAKERGYEVIHYSADWNKYGKSAGYRRNSQMADNADALVAFWDGSSRGTGHMLDLAKGKGLTVRICAY